MRTEEEDVVSGETRTYGNPSHYTVSDFFVADVDDICRPILAYCPFWRCDVAT